MNCHSIVFDHVGEESREQSCRAVEAITRPFWFNARRMRMVFGSLKTIPLRVELLYFMVGVFLDGGSCLWTVVEGVVVAF